MSCSLRHGAEEQAVLTRQNRAALSSLKQEPALTVRGHCGQLWPSTCLHISFLIGTYGEEETEVEFSNVQAEFKGH